MNRPTTQPGHWLLGHRRLLLWAALAAIALVQVVRVVAPDTGPGGLVLLLAIAGGLLRPINLPARLGPRWASTRLAGGLMLMALGLAYDALRAPFVSEGLAPMPDLVIWGALLGLAVLDGGTCPRILRLVGVEWTKLRRARIFLVGLGAAAVVTLLAGWLHDPLDGETGWAIAAQTLGTGMWAAEVFLLVLGATTIAGELGQGTLKMILPHAYRRAEWIVAKGLVLGIAALIFTLVVSGVSLGHAAITSDLGDIVKAGIAGFGEEVVAPEVFQTAAVMRSHLIDAIIAGFAALVATALLGLCLSCLFDSVVPALSTAFLLFLGLKSADVLLGLSREVLDGIYTSYPPQLREWTAKLGRGLNETWQTGYLTAGLVRSALTGALASLFAIAWFTRRDLHG